MLEHDRYRFFDQDIALRSDSAETLALMDTMFRRLRIGPEVEGVEPLCFDAMKLQGAGKGGVVRAGNKVYQVSDPEMLPAITHGLVLRTILSRVCSHLLFHAAVLSYGGKGYILAADSGCGKTTLSLALVRRGFKLLSDEVAALSLTNGLLEPYPRCLWVRAGTEAAFQALDWTLPHHLVALEVGERTAIHLTRSLLGDACRPDYLIVVRTSAETGPRPCVVTLDRLDADLAQELPTVAARIHFPGSTGAAGIDEGKGRFPRVEVDEAGLNALYAVCERHAVLVLDVDQQPVPAGFFQKAPKLEPLSRLPAILALLRGFLGSSRSKLIRKLDGQGPADLLWPLSTLLENTRCYRLTPGKLDQTVEVIGELHETP